MSNVTELRAKISEKIVMLRASRLSVFEKLVQNFGLEIKKHSKKSAVYKMITDADCYPNSDYLKLKELWSRNSIFEILNSPGVSYELLNESKDLLRDCLAYSASNESFAIPIPLLRKDPIKVTQEELDSVLVSLDNMPWNEQFELGYNIVALLGDAEVMMQRFLVRTTHEDWQVEAKRELITLQANNAGNKRKSYSDFKKHNQQYQDDYFFYYMYWNYIFIDDDFDFDDPVQDEHHRFEGDGGDAYDAYDGPDGDFDNQGEVGFSELAAGSMAMDALESISDVQNDSDFSEPAGHDYSESTVSDSSNLGSFS